MDKNPGKVKQQKSRNSSLGPNNELIKDKKKDKQSETATRNENGQHGQSLKVIQAVVHDSQDQLHVKDKIMEKEKYEKPREGNIKIQAKKKGKQSDIKAKKAAFVPNNSKQHHFDNEFIDGMEQAKPLKSGDVYKQQQGHGLKVSAKMSPTKSSDHTQVKLNSRDNSRDNSREKSRDNSRDQSRKTYRINKINSEAEHLNGSLSQIKELCTELNIQQKLFIKRNARKDKEVEKFIDRKNREEAEWRQKIATIKQKQAQQLKQSHAQQEQQLKKKGRSRAEMELSKILEARQKREQIKKQQAQKDKKNKEMFEQIRKQQKIHKKFHLRKEEEDRQKQAENQQKQKSYFAQRKQNYLRLDLKELDDHELKYGKEIKQLEEVKKAQREQKERNIRASHNQYLQAYRGANYKNAQNQYANRKQKKKNMSKHLKEYQDYVRKNFAPKHSIVHHKGSQLAGRNISVSMSENEGERHRYVNGIFAEKIPVKKRLAKSDAEIKKIGLDYLLYLKNLPKKPKEDPQKQLNTSELQTSPSRPRHSRSHRPLLDFPGRHTSLSLKLSSKPTRDEIDMLMYQLKESDRKIYRKQAIARYQKKDSKQLQGSSHEINESIVENIQRKLNLLNQL